jgi:chemotaxis protein histidine kinase CheA
MLSQEKQERLFSKFKDETTRQLALLRKNLPRLEQAPQDAELIRAMFIASHNIKSNLGTMRQFDRQFFNLDEVARKLEATFIGLQNGHLRPEPEVLNALDYNIHQIEIEFS